MNNVMFVSATAFVRGHEIYKLLYEKGSETIYMEWSLLADNHQYSEKFESIKRCTSSSGTHNPSCCCVAVLTQLSPQWVRVGQSGSDHSKSDLKMIIELFSHWFPLCSFVSKHTWCSLIIQEMIWMNRSTFCDMWTHLQSYMSIDWLCIEHVGWFAETLISFKLGTCTHGIINRISSIYCVGALLVIMGLSACKGLRENGVKKVISVSDTISPPSWIHQLV